MQTCQLLQTLNAARDNYAYILIEDLWLEILAYLDTDELGHMSMTGKVFKKLAENNRLWQML